MENNKTQKQSFRPFLKLIAKSKLPWGLYILKILLSMVISTLMVMLPKYLGKIVGGDFSRETFYAYVIIVVLHTCLAPTINILNKWLFGIVNRNVQSTVWDKFMKMPMKHFTKQDPSLLISRVTKDNEYVSKAIDLIFYNISVVYQAIITIITMYSMNAKITFVISLIIVGSIMVTLFLGRVIYRAQNEAQKKYSKFTVFLAERYPNMKFIKSSGTEKLEEVKGQNVIKDQYKAEIKLAKIDSLLKGIVEINNVLFTSTILIYGGILITQKEFTIEQLVSFKMLAPQLSVGILQFILAIQAIKQAQGATKEVSNILEYEDEKIIREKSFGSWDLDINFQNVTFSYNDKTVLDNLNFTVKKGKTTAILGPSGAGKTTILNLIERFYEPTKGSIKFGDTNIEDIHLNEWRDSIGYVYQNSTLIIGTIYENIVYGANKEVSKDEVIKAAKLANAYDFIMEFPNGFNTNVGELGGNLSGGQRQRVAIARTLIKDPSLLILDDSTCSLDTCNELEVHRAVKNLMKDRTTIIVSNKIQTIINADKIIVLEDGKINGSASHEQLFRQNEVYKKYYTLQCEC